MIRKPVREIAAAFGTEKLHTEIRQMPLERIELAAGLQALVDAAPDLELVAEPRRLPAFVIRGFESVPVRLR